MNALLLNITFQFWVAQVTEVIQWDVEDPCNKTMFDLKEIPWDKLDHFEKGNAKFCLIKKYWPIRTDNQRTPLKSTCDFHMEMYNHTTDWKTLPIYEKLELMECMEHRIMMDAIREKTSLKELPSDLLTNPYRKYVFGTEMLRGLTIMWNYYSDQMYPHDIILSDKYKEQWVSNGINVTHLKDLKTEKDVINMQTKYKIDDYFIWNNEPETQEILLKFASIFWSELMIFLRLMAIKWFEGKISAVDLINQFIYIIVL